MRDVVQPTGQPPTCPFCDQPFPLNALLYAHVELIHGQDGLKRLATDGLVLKDDYEFPELAVPDEEQLVVPPIGDDDDDDNDNNDDGGYEEDPPAPTLKIAKYHCDFCEFDANEFAAFDNHMMSAHGQEVS